MATNNDYRYMQEDLINPLLKCSICSKPFVNPVITGDRNRACRACISSHDVTPLTEKLILDMLDNIPVECLKCHAPNISRGRFEEHRHTQCPQRIVPCKAADLKCPWTGKYVGLDQHLPSCTFEILRPIFTEILMSMNRRPNDQQQLRDDPKEYRKEYEELKKEVEHLRAQRMELQDVIHQIVNQGANSFVNQVEELNRLYQAQIKRTDQLELEIQRLRKLFLKQLSLPNKFQEEFEQYKRSNDRTHEIQQLKEQLEQLQLEVTRLSEQAMNTPPPPAPAPVENSNEIAYMKQLFNQHDVQIKLLARKKCVIPAANVHTDVELEKTIDRFLSNSEINLDDKQLNDHDIDIVCKKAIVEKKCSKLRLQRNKISGKGATILANTLYNNVTLIELYLSKNQILDIGVHALAQTLAVNNSTLKILDLYSNNITDDGIEYLSDMLKINKSITRLGLGINQITDHGVRLLANAIIGFNKSLQQLALPSNKSISDKSVPSLIEIFKCDSSLNTLWLNDCSLSPIAIARLKDEAKGNPNLTFEI